MKTKRALVSVSDKSGIVDFCRALCRLGFEIISTGGTAKVLSENGISVKEISQITNFPEIMDGRVKTLHPKVHGGILAKRENPTHMKQALQLKIPMIDLVAVNLYPFKETVKSGSSFEQILENIDIGGPTLIRAAAKNFKDVIVVVDPKDYEKVLEALKKGDVPLSFRFELAKKAFNLTAHYDALIAQYLFSVDETGKPKSERPMPDTITLTFESVKDLRYGENPHQRGKFYREVFCKEPSVSTSRKLHGQKELSFNNIYDLDGALSLVQELLDEGIACAIIKHANPCGVAVGESPLDAYKKALSTDPVSAFGGIVAFNCPLDEETARQITGRFFECVIAPSFDEKALEILKQKKNLRVLEVGELEKGKIGSCPFDFKRVVGGLLLQDRDLKVYDPEKLKVVTDTQPSKKQWSDLLFAFKVVKWVKSNAVVFAKDGVTLAIGVGQTSRIDSVKFAAQKAQSLGISLRGSVLASEAFFPFRDSVDEAAKLGVSAIIQPGGSIRDGEVIQAANEHGIPMVFTGIRHFRH